MAIRRCPYCKAIIDESQKYCNNCGTQLLFPEDENIEEDIKGEKIIDEDFRDEPEDGEDADEQVLEEEIDLEDVIDGEVDFPDEKREEPAQPIEDEGPAEPEPQEPEPREAAPLLEPEKSGAGEIAAAVQSAPGGDEIAKKIEEKPTPGEPDAPIEAEAKAEVGTDPAAREPKDTSARDEIARLIEAMEKKQRQAGLTEKEEKVISRLEDSGNLPPWADVARETGGSGPVEEDESEKEEEKVIGAGDTVDFEEEVMAHAEEMTAEEKPPTDQKTIGIPERITKTTSEIAPDRDEEIPGTAAAVEIMKDQEDIEEPNVEERESRLGFFGRLKAVVFDLIFIALVWLGTVWLASRLMAVPLTRLVAASAGPLAIFFLVLFVGYMFLFLFFLGETLGGRLASPRD